jgi:glycosyltransferase involved in cell wall biosynthesis
MLYKVTVVIPTIGRKELYAAVESAQNQLGGVVEEIIVVRDPKFADVALDLPEQRTSVPYRVLSGIKGGVADNLNRAIVNSRTKLISWLSDDDVYSPVKVLRQINVIRRAGLGSENIDDLFLISSFALFDAETNQRTDHDISWLIEQNPVAAASYSLSRGLISGCSVLFSKALWLQAGGFPVEFKTTQDYVLWNRIISRIPRFLCDSFAGITTTVHAGMESRVLADTHATEKLSLQSLTFNSYVAAAESENISIAMQREIYFFPQSDLGLYVPFHKHESEDIRRLCEHQLMLSKYCLLLISDIEELTGFEPAAIAHRVGSYFRNSVERVAKLTGTNVPDAEIGWFLDAFVFDGKIARYVCGLPSEDINIRGKTVAELVRNAVAEYRYVLLVDMAVFVNEQSVSKFFSELHRFDSSESVQANLKTAHSATLDPESDGFQILARNPFLANEANLNAAS